MKKVGEVYVKERAEDKPEIEIEEESHTTSQCVGIQDVSKFDGLPFFLIDCEREAHA